MRFLRRAFVAAVLPFVCAAACGPTVITVPGGTGAAGGQGVGGQGAGGHGAGGAGTCGVNSTPCHYDADCCSGCCWDTCTDDYACVGCIGVDGDPCGTDTDCCGSSVPNCCGSDFLCGGAGC